MKGQITNGRSTPKYYVLNPTGIRPTVDRFPLSPRLSSLRGKTVYFVESLHASVFMEELAKRLPKYAPGVKTVFRRKPLGPMTDNPETWDEVAKKAHAMVSGTVMGASSGAFGVGWTVGIEKQGIPTILIVGMPFDKYYIPLSKEMFGMPALRCLNMALVPEHEIADITEAQYKEVLTKIIDGLTKPLNAEEKKAGKIVPKKQSRIAMTGTLEEVQDYFLKQRWTDGLPIIPPTEEKVKEMLKGTSHAPDEVIKTEYQEQVSINTYTVEKVAIVGVMAGCKPKYMPVLLAIAEALGPSSASQVSPSSMSLMTVVNGPIRNEIRMNRGLGATGPSNQANATIGRFVRLGLIALAGLVPGYNDMTGMGNPTRYMYCFPENEEDSPWKPFHVTMGHKPKESTVSIFSGGWIYNVLFSTASPDAILERIVKMRNGSMFLMSPGMAELYAKKGMSKEDLEKYIWEHALDPVSERKKLIWGTMRSDMYDNMSDDDLVPVFERDAVKIIIAGEECGITTTQVWNYFRPSMVSVDKWR